MNDAMLKEKLMNWVAVENASVYIAIALGLVRIPEDGSFQTVLSHLHNLPHNDPLGELLGRILNTLTDEMEVLEERDVAGTVNREVRWNPSFKGLLAR